VIVILATKGLPFRHERVAARTGMTCRTGKRLCETRSNSLGNALLPKSKMRQIFLATRFYKAEQFMLKSRQRDDSTLAIALGKAHEKRHNFSAYHN